MVSVQCVFSSRGGTGEPEIVQLVLFPTDFKFLTILLCVCLCVRLCAQRGGSGLIAAGGTATFPCVRNQASHSLPLTAAVSAAGPAERQKTHNRGHRGRDGGRVQASVHHKAAKRPCYHLMCVDLHVNVPTVTPAHFMTSGGDAGVWISSSVNATCCCCSLGLLFIWNFSRVTNDWR